MTIPAGETASAADRGAARGPGEQGRDQGRARLNMEFILADCAGEHVWTGRDWVTFRDYRRGLLPIRWFTTREQAQDEQENLARRHIYTQVWTGDDR